MRINPLAAVPAIVIAAACTANAQVVNGDFETAGTTTTFEGWDEFGNNMDPVSPNLSQSTELAAGGSTFSAKLFGQFISGQNDTGLVQLVPVTAGTNYSFTTEYAVGSADPLGTAELGIFIVGFLDANGTRISEAVNVLANSDTPADDTFRSGEIIALAPPGAVNAEILLLHVQLDTGTRGGAVYWDNVDFGISNTLANPSFDQTVNQPVFDNWAESGNRINNLEQVNIFPRSGQFNFKVFGQFSGVDNDSFITQTVPAAPGDSVSASVFHAQVAGDGLQAPNAGFMDIRFLDANGDEISVDRTTTALPGDPVASYQQATSSTLTAPAGTASVQLAIGMFQSVFQLGAIQYDDAELLINGTDVLANGSFEDAPADLGILGWDVLEGQNAFLDSTTATCDGANKLKIFGQFIGVENTTVVAQDLQANPGSTWVAEMTAFQDIIDALQGGNLGLFRVAFLDAAGNELAGDEVQVGDGLFSPVNLCEDFSITTDPAPAGTTTVRISAVLFQDAADSGGSQFFDNAALNCIAGDCSVNTGPVACSPADITTTGSANGIPDQVVDLSDFSFYLTLWSGSAPAADLTTTGSANGTPDGVVDLSDFSFYLTLWSAGCP